MERLSGSPITGEELRRETERIVEQTGDPRRLAELFNALDNDPLLIQECLVRPVLAERRARALVAEHNETDEDWSAWWTRATDDLGTYVAVPADLSLAPLPLPAPPETRGAGFPPAWNNGQLDDPHPHAPPYADYDPGVWTGSEFLVWGGGQPTWDVVPLARRRHTGVWTGTEMIVWGGISIDQHTTEPCSFANEGGARYDPATDSWTPVSSPGNNLSRRYGHSAVWIGDRMFLWGGSGAVSGGALCDSGALTNNGALYDPVTDNWTSVNTVNAPERRLDQTAVWSGTEVLVWGGIVVPADDTGGRYDPLLDAWRPMSTAGAPDHRRGHTAVWDGSRMLIWGGRTNRDTGGWFDPRTDAWEPTPTLGTPPGMDDHAGAWTGAGLLVFGSSSSTGGYLLDGDLDGDGVIDSADNCRLVDNAAQTDSDGDGFGDACDNCLADFNANQDDQDADGVGDVCDNCPLDANTAQSDTDGDGEGDACDACPLEPGNDGDGDGFCPSEDNCPVVYNPSQSDTDGDGLGDACDACPQDVEGNDDGDADGICDSDDNCPMTHNPLQEDFDGDGLGDVCDNCRFDPAGNDDIDGDGLGDVCDPCPFIPQGQDDEDFDGVCDSIDNCPQVPNEDQADADLDGFGDVCDNCPANSNVSQLDADGDGLGNVCDPCVDSVLNDTDQDGLCEEDDNCPFAANPGQEDDDGDGIGDACDPCDEAVDPDSDGDGVCDSVDTCVAVQNPAQIPDADQHQWAMSATASSEWSPTDYSGQQAAGPPESVGVCQDVPTNWSPLTSSADPEWVELSYEPSPAIGVVVHESLEAGFVTQIDLRDTGGVLHTVWAGGDSTLCGDRLTASWPETGYDVSSVVVHTQSPGWEEIDAVQLLTAAGDGFSPACDVCPAVHDPDQADADGDGAGDVCDCEPLNSTVRPSAVVEGLTVAPFSGFHIIGWPGTVGADSYNVFRGTLAELRGGSFGVCVAAGTTATTVIDGSPPAPSEVFVYVIQGVSAGCGPGSVGYRSNGVDRGAPTCP